MNLLSSPHSNVRCHENGLTLVELLVSLVVVGLLATAVFSFFLTTSQSVSQQSASGEMWQRGRNALAIMRQAIESAGYGLPSYSQCPNGVVGINNATGTPGALVGITASAQASGSSYYPDTVSGINTYSFSTVIGGGSFGGAPATTVTNVPNPNSASLKVNDTAPLNPGDMALIAPQGGGTCLLGQITNVTGKGTLNSSCEVAVRGSNATGGSTVVFNSGTGKTACFQANPNQLFSLVTGLGNTSLSGASLYDLGSQDFLFETFEIKENPAGSTPTLYMTQYTGAQASTPTPQALASGVVDLQIQYGLGMNGAVQQWVTPDDYNKDYTNFSAKNENIVAVQLAMLIRSSRYLPNSLSPTSFSIMGKTYTVPVKIGNGTGNDTGCFQGNCRHYEYHLFQNVIPVRNGIWQGD